MYAEEDLLPLSALQHLIFCERQCALIHVERLWADNRLTIEGNHLHRSVDETGRRSETRGNLRIARGLALRSLHLGLSGRADLVELHRAKKEAGTPAGAKLPGIAGQWHPFPVEHKRGRPKRNLSDRIQLCAQALCLEEMLATTVPRGALFYGKLQRRTEVAFDTDLRSETERAAQRLHELVAKGVTPRATYEPKCDHCSLIELCLPSAMQRNRSAVGYLTKSIVDG